MIRKQTNMLITICFAATWMFFTFPGRNFAQGGFYVDATADPDSICLGMSTQLNAFVAGGTAPFTYMWSPATFLTNPNIANPIASPTATIEYFITATDSTGDSAIDSVIVTIMTPPPSPGEITGPPDVCMESTTTYQIDPMAGVTSYSWTVPENATIVTGQNSATIEVLWGITPGVVSVIVGNDCGNSPPSTIEVMVSTNLPAPGAILGPDTGCTGIESTFSILEVSGAQSYEWTAPADASIITGQGTTEIIVIWGTSSGDISVVAQNVCGNSPPTYRTLTAGSLPGPAGEISGNDTVCLNHTGYLYTVPEIVGAATYIWSLPEGATIASGQGTHEITLDFNPASSSGNISVYGANDCGDGTPSSKPVVVSECAGVDITEFRTKVILYPNPAKETLNLLIRGRETDFFIMISDVTGVIRYTEKVRAIPSDYLKQIDLSGFPEGFYFIKLLNNNGYFLNKFVVQR